MNCKGFWAQRAQINASVDENFQGIVGAAMLWCLCCMFALPALPG